MSAIENTPDIQQRPRAKSALPTIRKVGLGAVGAALAREFGDFWARPSHYVFLSVIYPVLGIAIAIWTSGGNAFQLLYPLATGFALVGPLAGIGLYELSRRREMGEDARARRAFEVLRSPALGAMLRVGVLLTGLFVAWLFCAQILYHAFYGAQLPDDFVTWLGAVVTSSRGWGLIALGNLVGGLFALAVLATSVVAFPMLLDRRGSATDAIATSIRAVIVNPVPMLGWGVIVVVGLVLGSIPLFVGLAVALPILGHATWHLYRAVVE